MNYKILLFLLYPFCVFAQEEIRTGEVTITDFNSPPPSPSIIQEKTANNTYAYDENGLRTGLWVIKNRATGTIDSGNYIKGLKDGIWTCKRFSDIVSKTSYKNGIKNGEYLSYYPRRINHINERGYFKDGLKFGEWTTYYDNGKVNEISNYSIYKGYSFQDGKYSFYDEKGEIIMTGYYTKGIRTGKWETYFNGKLYEEKSYNLSESELNNEIILKLFIYDVGNLKQINLNIAEIIKHYSISEEIKFFDRMKMSGYFFEIRYASLSNKEDRKNIQTLLEIGEIIDTSQIKDKKIENKLIELKQKFIDLESSYSVAFKNHIEKLGRDVCRYAYFKYSSECKPD